jgi:peptide/nickel transport system permease protein
VLQAIPLLFGIALISFFLINLAPGDFLAAQRANPQVSNQTIHEMEVTFGLVNPETGQPTSWIRQFFVWMKNIVFEGNFGYSFSTRRPVFDVIRERMLATLWLSLAALTFALVLALPLGIYSAVRQYRWQDAVASFLAFVGLSIPNVFLALLALMFAKATGLFPLGGWRELDFGTLSLGGKAVDLLHHVALPAVVLGTGMLAVYMRQMRGNLLDILDSDYIRTARAKGLDERVVIVKHGVRNAINPIITLLGYSLSDLLSGSILVENVMSWPGLGRTVVEALINKDLYLVMASVVMASVMLIVGNLIADLLLAWSDPRIRLE